MKLSKQQLNNLFFIVGVLACVVMLFTFDVSFVELWEHLCHAGYWLVPILGVWILIYGINAWSWNTIIQSKIRGTDEHVSFMRVYRLTITGYALNYATPVGGLGGEPYRILELSKDVSNQHATSSVILYAMMHFFASSGSGSPASSSIWRWPPSATCLSTRPSAPCWPSSSCSA